MDSLARKKRATWLVGGLLVLLVAGVLIAITRPDTVDGYVTVRVGEHDVQARLADTPAERTQGLSDTPVDAPLEDRSMIFIFEDEKERIFWMNRMHFPLDVLWIRNGVVESLDLGVAVIDPETSQITKMGSEVPVDTVLELPAGTVEALGISKGDTVNVK